MSLCNGQSWPCSSCLPNQCSFTASLGATSNRAFTNSAARTGICDTTTNNLIITGPHLHVYTGVFGRCSRQRHRASLQFLGILTIHSASLLMIADYLFRQASEAKTSRAGSLSSKSCTLARSSSTVPSSAMTGPESQPISEEHAFVYMHCWYSLCKAHPLPRHRVPHFSCGFKKIGAQAVPPLPLCEQLCPCKKSMFQQVLLSY